MCTGIKETELGVVFGNGSTTNLCLDSLSTSILFECNPHNVWENDEVNAVDVSAYLINFYLNFENTCEVSFNVQTSSVLIVKYC